MSSDSKKDSFVAPPVPARKDPPPFVAAPDAPPHLVQRAKDEATVLPEFNVENTSGGILQIWAGRDSLIIPDQVVTVPVKERARILREAEAIKAAGTQFHGRSGRQLPPLFVITNKPAKTAQQIVEEEEARHAAESRVR